MKSIYLSGGGQCWFTFLRWIQIERLPLLHVFFDVGCKKLTCITLMDPWFFVIMLILEMLHIILQCFHFQVPKCFIAAVKGRTEEFLSIEYIE